MRKTIIWITLALTLSSCIEEKYNLEKSIDIKLDFADDGLTLPTSNSLPMALSQIIELNDSGQLMTDKNGNYYFYKLSTDMDSTKINIGQGSICNAVENIIDYHFKEDKNLKSTIINEKYNTAKLEFSINTWPQYAPDRMSESVRSLEHIKTPMSISFIIYDSNVNEFASEISEIRYHVPSYYELVDSTELTEKRVRINGRYEHIIHCKGVNFKAATAAGEKIGYNNATGELTFIGKVGMECTINTAHMNEYGALPDPNIKMRITIGTLGTNEVTGRFFQKEQIEIAPIEFDDLPEFIREEGVVIDLENPRVSLTVDNGAPIGATINTSLHSIRQGNEIASLNIGYQYGTDPIYFSPNARETVLISRKAFTELPDTVSSNVVVNNMMDILKIMPDKIEVDGWASTDSSQVVTIGLNQEYKIHPAYELMAPLIMGENMNLIYKKNVNDIHDKLKNFEVTRVTISATAISNIPLDLTATMKAIDEQGHTIDSIYLEQDQKIKGTTKSDIILTITGTSEDFQRVNSIELKGHGKCNAEMAGQQLNENQAITLENIKMTVY